MSVAVAMPEPELRAPSAPFVGPRPFEEDERTLFFGRDSEGTLLVNKILAGPLTVLFALSGVGKTSILKTLVLPELRKHEARVVYFDNWMDLPVLALREAVGAVIESPPPSAADSNLEDLARALNEQSDESLILVLDQFEQFFLRHPEQVDDLGRELGALARSNVDNHVVIVLREEYLGRLDAFRQHLLTISPARYRLTPIGGETARTALSEPPKRCGGLIESSLVDRLLKDLHVGTKASGVGPEVVSEEGISLPIMQIVGLHLWNAVSGDVAPTITADLYRSLGGRHGIVDAYVREAMRDILPEDHLDTARALDLLAPEAGVKMAYPLDVLSRRLDAEPKRVNGLLERLERRRIVRFRENDVVELTHDAFTEVLRGFIDQQLRADQERKRSENQRRKRRVRNGRIALVVALVLLSVLLGVGYRLRSELTSKRADLQRALDGSDCTAMTSAIRDLRREMDAEPSILTRAAALLVNPPLEEVAERLKVNQSAARACHGPRAMARDFNASPTGTPLVLAFRDAPASKGDAATGDIQGAVVAELWKRLAEKLWQSRQIRLPAAIDIQTDERLAAGAFVIKLGDRILVRRSLPERTDRVAVIALNPTPHTQLELQRTAAPIGFEPKRLRQFEARDLVQGTAAPWAAPVFKVIEERIVFESKYRDEPFTLDLYPEREAAIAIEAIESIAEQPAYYLTAGLTRTLLRQYSDHAPCLVNAAISRFDACKSPSAGGGSGSGDREACRSRAVERMVDRVHRALREAAKRGRPAAVLTPLLNRLADVPADSASAQPRQLVEWLETDDGRGIPPNPLLLEGASRSDWGCPRTTFAEAYDAYAEVGSQLDELERPIRVGLGSVLAHRLAPTWQLGPELEEALYGLRRRLAFKYGVSPPGISFRAEAWPAPRYDISLVGVKFRIANEVPDFSKANLIDSSGPLVRDLERLLDPRMTAAITVDGFAGPGFAAPNVRSWLRDHFTRNDLKLLLRAVMSRGGGASVARTNWLVASLPFWSLWCPVANAECLVEGLQGTQRARASAASSDTVTRPAMQHALDALEADKLTDALRGFQSVLGPDRELARREFVLAWAHAADRLLEKQVKSSCEVPVPGRDPAWGEDDAVQRSMIEDALELPNAKDDPVRATHLSLCSLMNQLDMKDELTSARKVGWFLSVHEADRQRYTPAELYWLGYRLFAAGARLEPADRELARELLGKAFESNPTRPEERLNTDGAFSELLSLCKNAKSDRCHWDLADLAEKLNLGVDKRWELFDALSRLPTYSTEKHLKTAKRVLEQITPQQFRAQVKRDRDYWGALLELLQFGVDFELASNAGLDSTSLFATLDAKQAQFGKMQLKPEHRAAIERELAFHRRSLLRQAGRYDEIAKSVQEQTRQASHASNLEYESLIVLMEAGRVDEAVAEADRLLDRQVENEDVLFLSAIGHLLLNDDLYAEKAERMLIWLDYRYRDYVRLMLFWRMSGRSRDLAVQGKTREAEVLQARARALLEDRLREIPLEETAQERLEGGDLGPWREMLVRYFLDPNEANRKVVFDALETSEKFAASPLSRGAQPLYAFRCEAHFYDALLQDVIDGPTPARERHLASLRRVIDEKCFGTYEMTMAKWLLGRSATNPPGPKN
jgi:hypothetical protein